MSILTFKQILELISESKKAVIVCSILLAILWAIQFVFQSQIYEAKGVVKFNIPNKTADYLIKKISSQSFIKELLFNMQVDGKSQDGYDILSSMQKISISSQDKILISMKSQNKDKVLPLLNELVYSIDQILSNEILIAKNDYILKLATFSAENIELSKFYKSNSFLEIDKLKSNNLSASDVAFIKLYIIAFSEERRTLLNEIENFKNKILDLSYYEFILINEPKEIKIPSILDNLQRLLLFIFCGILIGIFFTAAKKVFDNTKLLHSNPVSKGMD
jgi:hypothetical protein